MRNEQGHTLPDFLIIGAGKSGTTSLDHYLGQHPDIFLPDVKEPNFMAYELHSLSDFSDEETINHYKLSVTAYDEYVALFENANDKALIGEISNTYMYMPHALESIRKHVPKAKFIAVLRQPAERIFSRYAHLERVKKVPTPSFEKDVFDQNSIWWDRADLVQEGFYAKHLKKFYDHFPAENIKVLLFEELIKNTESTLNDITEFLGVAPFEFETGTQFNKSGKIKNESMNKLVGHDSVIIKGLKATIPGIYKKIKENSQLKNMVEKMRSRNIEKLHLTPDLKNRITTEIYHDDIINLQSLIKKDLSHWL